MSEYYGLEFVGDAQIEGSIGWFKANEKRLISDGPNWPWWSEDVAKDRPKVVYFEPALRKDFQIVYVNFAYRIPPPIYAVKQTFLELIGQELFEEWFHVFQLEMKGEGLLNDWKAFVPKAKSCVYKYKEVRGRRLCASEIFAMIVDESFFRKLEHVDIPDAKWVKLTPRTKLED